MFLGNPVVKSLIDVFPIRDHPHTTSDFRGGGGVSPNPMKSDDGWSGGLAKSDVGF